MKYRVDVLWTPGEVNKYLLRSSRLGWFWKIEHTYLSMYAAIDEANRLSKAAEKPSSRTIWTYKDPTRYNEH